jgi:purine-binding chemotaxis protein CheW
MSIIQFVTFDVNDRKYGIDILRVREVLKQVICSPVPGAHPAIVGLMNLRGQVVTVIDLGQRLDAQALTQERNTCLILKTDEELERQDLLGQVSGRIGTDAVGILVDEMGEVTSVDRGDLEDPPAQMSADERNLIENVVMLESTLLTQISLDRVLDLSQ